MPSTNGIIRAADDPPKVTPNLTAPSSVPQRMEVRRPVVVRDDGLAIDQK
jgi:hypothetical protein